MAESKNTPAISKRENIQVFVRVRPMNEKERLEKKNQNVVDLKRDREVVVRDRANSSMTKTFSFDRAFGPVSKQLDVYKSVAQPMIAEVLAGYNCTIFAYGQTGTGKTYTMEGERTPGDGNSWDKDPLCGLVPRVLSHMFDELRVKNIEFTMAVNYLELYNEELIDLLSPEEDNTKLRLFEDAANKGSVIVQGLTDVRVLDKKQVYDILTQGSKKRQTAATFMNATSSRSHTIFTVTIHIRESTEAGEDLIRTGKINLVDLAGSENISRSGATNQRAKEAGNINQSLLTLGRVITALVEKTPHIPYRESKLTRLLQDSLGGKTKTCIVATVSPVLANLEETLSTLDYAHRAKSITNRPQINQRLSKQAFIKEYDQEIERLRKDLAAQRSGHGIYVDPENYNEMNLKLDRQDLEILEKIQHIRALEEEKERREAMVNELAEKLEEKTQQLEETSVALAVTERDRDDKEVLLQHHRTTEDNLKVDTTHLIKVTDKVVDDLDKTQEALARKRHLEMQNKKTVQGFSATVAATTQSAIEASNLMQQRQKEIISEARRQLDTTQQMHSEAMTEILTLVENFSTTWTNRVSALHSAQQVQQTQAEALEQHHLESFDASMDSLKKIIRETAEQQKEQLQKQSGHMSSLEAIILENTVFIQELAKEKTAQVSSTVLKHKEALTISCAELKKNNLELAELLKAEKARSEYFSLELKKKIDLRQQATDKWLQEMRQLDEASNSDSETFRVSSQSAFDHGSELTAKNHTLLDASKAHEQDCDTINQELDSFSKQICDIPVQQEEKLQQVLRQVAQVTQQVVKVTDESVITTSTQVEAVTKEAEAKKRARLEAAKAQIKVQMEIVSEMKPEVEAHKALSRQQLELGKRRVDAQVAQVELSHEKVEQEVEAWGQQVGAQFEDIRGRVEYFVDSELKDYQPTGATPARCNRDYPRELKFTSPAPRILARYHAEQQRLQNGGDSGTHSPVSSSHNSSSHSDIENGAQDLPVIAKEPDQPVPAQRRILSSKNN